MNSRFSEYRMIRYRRTYRTLGRMTWWRVALGIALLILVFLISGTVSVRLANAGHFKTAEALMISKSWMETYKPEAKAYIEAGVLYQDGDYAAAAEQFGRIQNLEAAAAMRSDSLVRLAAEKLSGQDMDAAWDALTEADAKLLSETRLEEYREICSALCEYYSGAGGDTAAFRAETLRKLLIVA